MAGRVHPSRLMLGLLILVMSLPSLAEEVSSIADWFLRGNFNLDLRYRIETVDQDFLSQDAFASTLRTQVQFETARFDDFSFLVEVENVTAIGSEQYNSGANGRSSFPVVLDPEDTELNQAFLAFRRSGNRVRLGRQVVNIDNERFFGDLDFRQNQQTFDALMWMNTALPSHRFIYGYMDRVRRFLSDENPDGEIDMNTHLFNYRYKFSDESTLSFYGYLLDMQTPGFIQRSHKNFGLRYAGSIGGGVKLLYALEYADQSPHGDGLDSNEANYLAIEVGSKFPNQWVLAAGLERLSGDGTYAFQTPFGTNHKFNGFADVFAGGTPAIGLSDIYLKLNVPVFGTQLSLAFHDFQSNQGSVDFGTELDFVMTRRFLDHYSVGVAYSMFDGDDGIADVNKFWTWVTVEF